MGSMKGVTAATAKAEKKPRKASRGRKAQRPISVRRKVPLTGSLGGTTTVYTRISEGVQLLRKTALFTEEEWQAILAEKARSKAPAVEIIRAAVRQYLDL